MTSATAACSGRRVFQILKFDRGLIRLTPRVAPVKYQYGLVGESHLRSTLHENLPAIFAGSDLSGISSVFLPSMHSDWMNTMFAYFGAPGPVELIIIAAIILLLFGNRLPSVMRSLGKGIVEFKKGVQGVEDEIEEASNPKQLDDAAQSKP